MPDVSLQWIGRQLWGLTIQIPRIVSGNSALEHVGFWIGFWILLIIDIDSFGQGNGQVYGKSMDGG